MKKTRSQVACRTSWFQRRQSEHQQCLGTSQNDGQRSSVRERFNDVHYKHKWIYKLRYTNYKYSNIYFRHLKMFLVFKRAPVWHWRRTGPYEEDSSCHKPQKEWKELERMKKMKLNEEINLQRKEVEEVLRSNCTLQKYFLFPAWEKRWDAMMRTDAKINSLFLICAQTPSVNVNHSPRARKRYHKRERNIWFLELGDETSPGNSCPFSILLPFFQTGFGTFWNILEHWTFRCHPVPCDLFLSVASSASSYYP